ncbi:hypothetical protein [Calidifontibacter terrae]
MSTSRQALVALRTLLVLTVLLGIGYPPPSAPLLSLFQVALTGR